jgi:hypothetical protein
MTDRHLRKLDVRNNPIRAGLAASADEWKYESEVTQLRYD